MMAALSKGICMTYYKLPFTSSWYQIILQYKLEMFSFK